MNEILTLAGDAWEQLTRSPIWFVIAVFALAFGLFLKWAKFFDNRFIPSAVVSLTTLLYAILGDATKIKNPYPQLVLALYGFILGFLVWGSHRFLLKKLEKFLPDGFFPPGSFDTNQFQKDKTEDKVGPVSKGDDGEQKD